MAMELNPVPYALKLSIADLTSCPSAADHSYLIYNKLPFKRVILQGKITVTDQGCFQLEDTTGAILVQNPKDLFKGQAKPNLTVGAYVSVSGKVKEAAATAGAPQRVLVNTRVIDLSFDPDREQQWALEVKELATNLYPTLL